jgi:polyketide biosynthesis enoyl-CoA hydratase PksH
MQFNSIQMERGECVVTITINRIESNNSITQELLTELNIAFDEIEKLTNNRVVLIQGKNGVFCTGMDFGEAVSQFDHGCDQATSTFLSASYLQTIKRLSLLPQVVICKVDGKVMAGGVGIVAASDLVVATHRSQFSLSEALWGLLPGCVAPYLIRRIGFQSAYKMALTTMNINAQKAYEINLIDELTASPEDIIRQMIVRLVRLEMATIKNIKNYFRKMWIINDEMEKTAIDEANRINQLPEVQSNIRDYVHHQRFPWEKRQ